MKLVYLPGYRRYVILELIEPKKQPNIPPSRRQLLHNRRKCLSLSSIAMSIRLQSIVATLIRLKSNSSIVIDGSFDHGVDIRCIFNSCGE